MKNKREAKISVAKPCLLDTVAMTCPSQFLSVWIRSLLIAVKRGFKVGGWGWLVGWLL